MRLLGCFTLHVSYRFSKLNYIAVHLNVENWNWWENTIIVDRFDLNFPVKSWKFCQILSFFFVFMPQRLWIELNNFERCFCELFCSNDCSYCCLFCVRVLWRIAKSFEEYFTMNHLVSENGVFQHNLMVSWSMIGYH